MFLNSELIRIQSETNTAISLRKDEKETFQKAKTDHEEVIQRERSARIKLKIKKNLFSKLNQYDPEN